MTNYQYATMPFTGGTKSNDSSPGITVAKQLEELLNDMSLIGWEYYRMDTVHVAVAPGCLAGLFGAKADLLQYDVMVFRRPVA